MADEYVVERRMHIDAPPAVVHERVVGLRRWQDWSPWEDLDDDLERRYSGSDEGVGQVYEWSGNRQAGRGRMEVTGVVPDERVEVDLQFIKPFRSSSTMAFVTAPADGGTDATWTLRGPRTVMVRVMGLFSSMDKLIGPDFEKGLDRLRAVSESSGGAGAD